MDLQTEVEMKASYLLVIDSNSFINMVDFVSVNQS